MGNIKNIKDNINVITNIKDIFTYYNDIDLFAKCLNITSEVIENAIKNKKAINSPMRNDKNPSVSFYQVNYNGIFKTKMQDFNGSFKGDIIDLILYINKWNINTDFPKIIKEIERLNNDDNNNKNKSPKYIFIDNKFKNILVFTRDWNKIDKDYWNKYRIPISFLKEELVFPINIAFINDTCIYKYNEKDIGYAYYLLQDINDNNKDYWKLYFPFRSKHSKKKRFITNGSIMQGIITLKKEKILIITKSNKDRILIKYLAKKYNLSVTSVGCVSENSVISEKEFNQLETFKFKSIYSLYDIDNTGIRGMKELKKRYNIQPLILPRQKIYSSHSGIVKYAKDLSDYLYYFPNKENDLVNKFIKYEYNKNSK